MPISRTLAAAGLAAALLVIPACSDDGDDTTDAGGADTSAVDTTGDSASVDELAIDEVWIRAMPAASGMTAGYAQITSPIDDELLEVRVDASVAGTVELHETVAAEMDAPDGMDPEGMDPEGMEPGDMGDMGDTAATHDGGDADGMGDEGTGDDAGHGAMTMRQVESIPVPAGTTVTLEPGGLHIMFLEVPAQLEIGQQIELTFVFAEAGEVTVTAEVRAS